MFLLFYQQDILLYFNYLNKILIGVEKVYTHSL